MDFEQFFDWSVSGWDALWFLLYALLSLGGAWMLKKAQDANEWWADVMRYTVVGTFGLAICASLFSVVAQQKEVVAEEKQVVQNLMNTTVTRPFFTHTRTEVRKLAKGVYTLTVYVQNNEIPVTQMTSQLIVMDAGLDSKIEPLHRKKIVHVNDTGPRGIYWQYWATTQTKISRPAFVVFQLRYANALNDEPHEQRFFWKFLGVSQNIPTGFPQQMNADQQEKRRILHYLKSRGIAMLGEEDI